jgi:hypothetical protein
VLPVRTLSLFDRGYFVFPKSGPVSQEYRIPQRAFQTFSELCEADSGQRKMPNPDEAAALARVPLEQRRRGDISSIAPAPHVASSRRASCPCTNHTGWRSGYVEAVHRAGMARFRIPAIAPVRVPPRRPLRRFRGRSACDVQEFAK